MVDVPRLLRFSLFGSLYVAPTVYQWVKLSGKLISGTSFGAAISKALIEQVTYGPFSIVSFFFGISILEGKTTDSAIQEVKNKFWPTWKVLI